MSERVRAWQVGRFFHGNCLLLFAAMPYSLVVVAREFFLCGVVRFGGHTRIRNFEIPVGRGDRGGKDFARAGGGGREPSRGYRVYNAP